MTTTLTVPEQPSIPSFKLDPLNFDTTDSDSIKDALEIALTDAGGNSLVPPLDWQKDTFFNLSEGMSVLTGAGASYDAATKTVKLNLTGIAPGTNANLVFRLVNNDGDTGSTIGIKALSITNAPTGTIAPTQILESLTRERGGSIDFNNIVDVTPSLNVRYQRTSFHEEDKLLYTDVELKNIGTYAVDAPLIVVVKNISNPTVQPRDYDGLTPEGMPYYNFSTLVAADKLDPEQLSSSRNLVFYNPEEVQFAYDLEILSGLNQNPLIETRPNLEAVSSQTYRYDVDATDADGDSLTYRLLAAPTGMTIDSTTGIVSWDTSTADLGDYIISVEASDGRGGTDRQDYALSVIETPPNRPPVFTFTPDVNANINVRYRYDANATDADGDALLYKLINAPDGMTVDATTGEITWNPPATMVYGDTVVSSIGNAGERDSYTFSGVLGQRLYFDPLRYTGAVGDWIVRVYSPSGTLVLNTNIGYEAPFTLNETGNYKLVVEMNGANRGQYAFSLIDLDVIPLIQFDKLVSGTLVPGSEADLFKFAGMVGERVYFDKLTSYGGLDWVLFNERNQVIWSSAWQDVETILPYSGDYLLALRGNGVVTSTGNYAFNLVIPDEFTFPMSLGSIISGNISEKGEKDNYTFTGAIGQQLFYDALGGNYFTARV